MLVSSLNQYEILLHSIRLVNGSVGMCMTNKTPEKNGSGSGGSDQAPTLDELASSRIGQRLRVSFEDMLNEEVPDRFHDLLNRLESSENGGKGGSSAQ